MRLASLLSGGIDSPVAAFTISPWASELIFVHADNRPYYGDQSYQNFVAVTTRLKLIVQCPVRVYRIPHGPSLQKYLQDCNPKLTCIFCKRMMMRYAEAIAVRDNASAIVTGESLGQVASQTLQNLRAIEDAVRIPILRPLIGLDKEDIIQTAKRIGTYELSTVRTTGCSAVPFKPATRARLDHIHEEEAKLDIQGLVQEAVGGSEELRI
jgi:tRNA uracil 4-sulfurtransferase